MRIQYKMQVLLFPESSWSPKGGWDTTISQEQRMLAQNTYSYLHTERKLSKDIAEKYVMMNIMKSKYPDICYSSEDEHMLKRILKN